MKLQIIRFRVTFPGIACQPSIHVMFHASRDCISGSVVLPHIRGVEKIVGSVLNVVYVSSCNGQCCLQGWHIKLLLVICRVAPPGIACQALCWSSMSCMSMSVMFRVMPPGIIYQAFCWSSMSCMLMVVMFRVIPPGIAYQAAGYPSPASAAVLSVVYVCDHNVLYGASRDCISSGRVHQPCFHSCV